MRVIALFALATIITYPIASLATQDPFDSELHYDRHERLKSANPSPSGFAGATNVEIKEVEPDDLPDFIRAQAHVVASQCTDSPNNASLIKFYRYTSDLTRQVKLHPNYIADLSGLAKKTQSACIIGHACLRGECTLIGYNSTGQHMWNQDFAVMIKGWEPKTVEDPKTKAMITLLEITSVCNKVRGAEQRDTFTPFKKSSDKDDPNKDDKEKEKNKQGCVTNHIWLETGLLGYQPAMNNSYTLPVAPDDQEPQPTDD